MQRGGGGAAIMELKLAQELASMDQDPLFPLFLDLRKAYKDLERGRLPQKLAGYGMEPNLWGLLVEFWELQEVVTCQNGLHGPQFLVTRETTQGVLDSLTLFNVKPSCTLPH